MVTVFAEIESIEVEGEGAEHLPAVSEGESEAPKRRQPKARAGMIGSRGAATPHSEEDLGSMLGPSDIVPIQYSAVPGTTTNIPGTHAYPPDQEGQVGVPVLTGVLAGVATIKVKLAEPHSGSFEIKVSQVPAGTLTVGKCRLMLSEA